MDTTKKTIFVTFAGTVLIVLFFLTLPPAGAWAANEGAEKWPKSLTWAGGTVGGTWYLQAATAAKIVKQYVGIECTPEAGASARSVSLIERGELDMATNWAELAYQAVAGLGPYKDKPARNQRFLFCSQKVPYLLYVRKDTGIQFVKDLKGRKISGENPAAFMIWGVLEAMLNGAGLGRNDVTLLKWTSHDEAITAMEEKRADGWINPGDEKSAFIQQLNQSIGISTVTLNTTEIDTVIKRFPKMVPYSIEAGIIPGSDRATHTVGDRGMNMCRVGLPENLVYEIIKAIMDHSELIRNSHNAFRNFDAAFAFANPSAPFHAGVVRYLKEKGMWTSELSQIHQGLLSKVGATE